jgi:predicted metal-binding membrane protein
VTPQNDGVLVALLKRDQWIVLAALAALTLLAWAWLLHLNSTPMATSQPMPGMGNMVMPRAAPQLGLSASFALFAMWAIMMIGMMTPSVAPMVLTYAGVARNYRRQGTPFASAFWFAGGYFAAWILFALAASLGQIALDRIALLSPMMATTSAPLGGAILIAAGLYQWTPLKDACLSRCAGPLQFIQSHGGFQPRALGSLRLGVLHGLYCVGCCWILMALLFVTGVMNLLWIAILMLAVLAEKIVPGRPLLSRLLGTAFILAGLWIILFRAAI